MNSAEILATLQAASARIAQLEAERGALEAERDRLAAETGEARGPVAIVGTALRFPGAATLSEYWELLLSGGDAITEPPPGRFAGLPRPPAPHLLAGYLHDIARFDHALFSIAPDEARHMDPQQRHLLELTFAALVDAGIPPQDLADRAVGVFLGLAKNFYGERPGNPSAHSATGGLVSCAAGRIAHQFSFAGPAMVVDTACSSALVAIHLAVRALRAGEIDTAIVGASNL
ncbi:MAG: polyketide synthase, partial [Pseudomonadota bacterium]